MTHIPSTSRRTRSGVRRYAPAFALALAVTAAGAGTVAAAGPTTPRETAERHSRLHFDVEFSPHSLVDVPPRQQLQPGDYSVFSDRLLDPAGRVVGVQGGSGLVTKVRASNAQVFFDLAVRLRHGQIAAQGLSTTAPEKRLAVVGGTGRYAGATGHIVLVEHGDGAGSLTVVLKD